MAGSTFPHGDPSGLLIPTRNSIDQNTNNVAMVVATTVGAEMETPIRRACNRCHAQKLSCKRLGDEPCERCVRLKTECRSSPSLRYRRTTSAGSSTGPLRSPRTGRRATLSQPSADFVLTIPGGLSSSSHDFGNADHQDPTEHPRTSNIGDNVPAAASDAILDMTGFGYGFGHNLGNYFIPDANTSPQLAQGQRSQDGRVAASVTNFSDNSHQQPQQHHHRHQTSLSGNWGSSGSISPSSRTDMTFVAPVPQAMPIPAEEGCHSTSAGQTFPSPVGFGQPHQHQDQKPRHRRHPSFQPQPGDRSEATSEEEPCSQGGGLAPEQGPIMLQSSPRTTETMAAQSIWLTTVADINRKLWELTGRVPYQVRPDRTVYALLSLPSRVGEDESGRREGADGGFPLDQMFSLSRRLVEVVEEAVTWERGNRQSMAGPDGSATGPCSSSTAEPTPPFVTQLDPGSALLVLSTYVRLLELYQRVFHLVDLEITHGSPLESFTLCRLPDVSLGAFLVVPSPILQMILTIKVAEGFLGQLRDIVESLSLAISAPNQVTRSEGAEGGAAGSFANVIDVALAEIRTRESVIRDELGEIRARLEGSGAK